LPEKHGGRVFYGGGVSLLPPTIQIGGVYLTFWDWQNSITGQTLECHSCHAMAELQGLEMRGRGENGLQKCEFIWPGGLAARDYYETNPTSALFSADGLNGVSRTRFFAAV